MGVVASLFAEMARSSVAEVVETLSERSRRRSRSRARDAVVGVVIVVRQADSGWKTWRGHDDIRGKMILDVAFIYLSSFHQSFLLSMSTS